MTKPFTRALTVALAIATLSGCGAEGLLASVSSNALNYQGLNAGNAPLGRHGGKMDGPKGGFGVAQFAGLDLTEEQKTQLQAIAEKYKPAERPENTVAELLEAETIDPDALRAALAARGEKPADNHLAMLVETRAVLTDAQRAKLVEQLQARGAEAPAERPAPPAGQERPDPAERTAQLVEKLGLNETQKAALQAFQAKLEAGKPAELPARPDHAAMTAAMVTFWQTGDTTALAATRPTIERPAFPVDEFIALAQVLTVEQRQQILGHGFGGHKRGPGGHGGPRGR